MNENVKLSQQEEDSRTQVDLSGKVGVRPTTPEKSATSPWSAVERMLSIG
jgi:hypothetical protein